MTKLLMHYIIMHSEYGTELSPLFPWQLVYTSKGKDSILSYAELAVDSELGISLSTYPARGTEELILSVCVWRCCPLKSCKVPEAIERKGR